MNLLPVQAVVQELVWEWEIQGEDSDSQRTVLSLPSALQWEQNKEQKK